MELNVAINTIKKVCQENKVCTECPMNVNCNEQPEVWKDVSDQVQIDIFSILRGEG